MKSCKWCSNKVKRTDTIFCSRGCYRLWCQSNPVGLYPLKLHASEGGIAARKYRYSRYSAKGLDKRLEALRRWREEHPELLREHNRKIAPLGFKAIYEKAPYIEDGLKFQSQFELEVYRKLRGLGLPIQVQFQVGSSFFDFKIDHTFIEAHPFAANKRNPLDGKTLEEYYNERRQILDNNGYQNYKLEVVTVLAEADGSAPCQLEGKW